MPLSYAAICLREARPERGEVATHSWHHLRVVPTTLLLQTIDVFAFALLRSVQVVEKYIALCSTSGNRQASGTSGPIC
jgi:hypothetical protein